MIPHAIKFFNGLPKRNNKLGLHLSVRIFSVMLGEYWPLDFSVQTSLHLVCTVKTLGQYSLSMALALG